MARALEANARLIIRRPPAAVYEAFVDPEIMARFWFPWGSDRLDASHSVQWKVSTSDPEAPDIDVRVIELVKNERIHLEWGGGGEYHPVQWRFTPHGDDATVVDVTESGYTGAFEAQLDRALDATAGFNLVLAAAKAWLEHGVELKVVQDKAPS